MKTSLRCVTAGFALIGLVGCGSQSDTATPEQTKAFEGGPMPPGAQERAQAEMAKAREEAERRANAQRGQTPP